MSLGFAVVRTISIWMPWALGNRCSVTRTVANRVTEVGPRAFGLITLLLLAKVATMLITAKTGVWGGILNPGIALGVALGGLTGFMWSLVWPGSNLVTHVFVGAAAFLGASIKALPIGSVLVLEFMYFDVTVLVPTALMITGTTAAASWWHSRGKKHDENNDNEETGPVTLTTGPVEKVN